MTIRARARRALAYALAVAAVATASMGFETEAAHAADVIEAAYSQPGTWGPDTPDMVVDQTTFAMGTLPDYPGGGTNFGYNIYHPQDMGENGYDHPVILWGNGSLAWPIFYEDELFEHLVSWGYVIIASNSWNTGSGVQILDGLNRITAQNSLPGGTYEGKLDLSRVGAMGHSQGAGGALMAALNSGGRVDTVVTWAIPDTNHWCVVPAPIWEPPCVGAPDANALSSLTSSVFLTRGAGDTLATEAQADQWYARLPGRAAKGSLVGGHHTELTGTVGYVTAWLQYQLRGDVIARGAFAGTNPELPTNGNWVTADWNRKLLN